MTSSPPLSPSPSIDESYRVCREIARKQAKNFYYAFVALPEHKRNAICAVYAFMRHADDLSDDDSLSIEQRRTNLSTWLDAWHRASSGEATADPVFIALADAQARFQISQSLLDQLVEGTAMDLHRAAQSPKQEAGQYDTYPLSTISTATAISSRPSSDSSASASSATPIRAPKNSPRKPASPFSSPISCATFVKISNAAASIFL